MPHLPRMRTSSRVSREFFNSANSGNQVDWRNDIFQEGKNIYIHLFNSLDLPAGFTENRRAACVAPLSAAAPSCLSPLMTVTSVTFQNIHMALFFPLTPATPCPRREGLDFIFRTPGLSLAAWHCVPATRPGLARKNLSLCTLLLKLFYLPAGAL